ncbi:anti-sigma factor family protein [Amycolatopsis anabasis]|uniref:anti-sigma factor family protein n=1 Tax=Amycolatopsis anabasis TaxID=1840409 RepID=UPI00131B001F|nr:hypothetical protein [Amycolatopsis anabasis]
MTDESRGIGETVGPPWSVDVLADLHAGVLDEQEAARLWPRVNADPEARAIIEALESTTADLAALSAGPVEPMPAEFAAKLDAALAEEARQAFPAATAAAAPAQAGVAPVVDLAARRKRKQRLGWGAGLLTAAAAAVAAVAITVPNSKSPTEGNPIAQPPVSSAPGDSPLALRSDQPEAALGGAMGARDFGPLGDQQRLDACLQANGLDPAVKPAGIKSVTVDGKPATLVILTTGKYGQFRLVAFPPTCGPGSPGTLMDKVVGAK